MKNNSSKIPTIFFGTHDFAATILQALIDAPNISVELVITQPDKPVGRKKILTPPPVKVLAEKHGLTVDQPVSLKQYTLDTGSYTLGVCAQYGGLIPKHILDAPKHGILNVHTSLLPKYRGASPIQSALLSGDDVTGVTIMQMEEGLDTGPILLQKETPIDPNETYLDLDKRLAVIGAEALLEAIPGYIDGSCVPKQQDDALATHCKKLSREDGKIDWHTTSQTIYNQYRALTPWPGVWTVLDEKRLKLLVLRPSTEDISPGQILVKNGTLHIGTGDTAVEILRLQLEGKPAMDASTFLQGHQHINGEKLL